MNFTSHFVDERRRKGGKKRCLRFRPSCSLSYSVKTNHYIVVIVDLIICSGGYNLTFYINELLISLQDRLICIVTFWTVIVWWQLCGLFSSFGNLSWCQDAMDQIHTNFSPSPLWVITNIQLPRKKKTLIILFTGRQTRARVYRNGQAIRRAQGNW